MGKKLIITAALCGAGTTKKQTPCVPITPEEIAADAVACAKAGAAVIHIHVRDENGVNSMDTKRFCQVVDLVREECGKAGVDPVLNLTTSGSKWPEDIRRAHLPILKPEMCSYDPGTMNWANSYIFSNSPAFLEQLGHDTQELGIKPECEIFDGGMMGNVDYYVKKGVLKAPLHFQFCMGCANGIPGSLKNLIFMKETMESLCPGSTWSCFGVGHCALEMLYGAVALGGHIRVGMEDNVVYEVKENGEKVMATNHMLVERAVNAVKAFGNTPATPDEARRMLGIPAFDGGRVRAALGID